MQSYKVQFTKTYVIDIQAHNEEEATIKARQELTQAQYNGVDQNYESDNEVIVFDVTGSDDDFTINQQ
jgi:hypothetical protein